MPRQFNRRLILLIVGAAAAGVFLWAQYGDQLSSYLSARAVGKQAAGDKRCTADFTTFQGGKVKFTGFAISKNADEAKKVGIVNALNYLNDKLDCNSIYKKDTSAPIERTIGGRKQKTGEVTVLEDISVPNVNKSKLTCGYNEELPAASQCVTRCEKIGTTCAMAVTAADCEVTKGPGTIRNWPNTNIFGHDLEVVCKTKIDLRASCSCNVDKCYAGRETVEVGGGKKSLGDKNDVGCICPLAKTPAGANERQKREANIKKATNQCAVLLPKLCEDGEMFVYDDTSVELNPDGSRKKGADGKEIVQPTDEVAGLDKGKVWMVLGKCVKKAVGLTTPAPTATIAASPTIVPASTVGPGPR